MNFFESFNVRVDHAIQSTERKRNCSEKKRIQAVSDNEWHNFCGLQRETDIAAEDGMC